MPTTCAITLGITHHQYQGCLRNYTLLGKCGPVNYIVEKSRNARPIVVHVDKMRPCFEGQAEAMSNQAHEYNEENSKAQRLKRVRRKSAIERKCNCDGTMATLLDGVLKEMRA